MSNSSNNSARAHWASSIGFVLAAAGSAVGLGNIWKFPRMAYNYGGGAFILIYLLIVLLVGCTVMLTEFVIGRRTHKNCIGAFRMLARRWTFVGALGIITGFVILSYYIQVAGWVLKYMLTYLLRPSVIFADPSAFLTEHTLGASSFPLLGAVVFPAVIMLITVFIVLRGISGGIEKANKILMPLLLLMLLALLVRGLTLPGTRETLTFFTTLRLSDINGNTIMVALGQAFFSLSLGMGVMCTYASYLPREENLVKNTFTVCGLDTLVALIASLAIIPIALAASLEIPGGAGSAGFGFISMAAAFSEMPFGRFFGFLFYFLMLFAAITSAISILEGTVAYFVEERGKSRKAATINLGIIIYLIGIPFTLSQANLNITLPWLDATGITYPLLGDWMEYLTDRLLMPLGALLFCVFVGWFWGVDNATAEIEQCGVRFKLRRAYSICVRYVAPAAIILILLRGFGVV